MSKQTEIKIEKPLRLKSTPLPGNLKDLPNPVTWTFTPDPWIITTVDKVQAYKLDTLRFTIWENNGATQYTLQWNATSLGWQSRAALGIQTPDIRVYIEDSGGGILDTWDIGTQDLPCGGPYGVVYTNPKGKLNILTNSVLVIFIELEPFTVVNC